MRPSTAPHLEIKVKELEDRLLSEERYAHLHVPHHKRQDITFTWAVTRAPSIKPGVLITCGTCFLGKCIFFYLKVEDFG